MMDDLISRVYEAGFRDVEEFVGENLQYLSNEGRSLFYRVNGFGENFGEDRKN